MLEAWRRLWRPRMHKGIMLRVEYRGELLLLLDSDSLRAIANTEPEGWRLFRPVAGRDWPDIIIKPVMLPD